MIYLKREQRSLIMNMPPNIASLRLEHLHVLPNVLQIFVPTTRIHNQVDMIVLDLRHHGVINRPSLLIGEHGQRPRAGLEAGDVGDHQLLKERDAVLALEAEAAHVGDIEEAAVGAAVEGGVHDGVLVLDRHRPAGEGDHLAAILHVEVVEGRLLEFGFGGSGDGEGAAVGAGGGEAAG